MVRPRKYQFTMEAHDKGDALKWLWEHLPRDRDGTVLQSTALDGYEIKSDVDSMSRLDRQSRGYGYVFDRMTLVTTAKHLEAGLAHVPAWWGIRLATMDKRGNVRLTWRRRPRRNAGVIANALVQLLWRDETIEELRARGIRRMTKLDRWGCWMALVKAVGLAELRRIVIQRVKARSTFWLSQHQPGWRSLLGQETCRRCSAPMLTNARRPRFVCAPCEAAKQEELDRQ